MARKTIGLALSGGGARGFSHLGVLKVLAENEIPIDYVAGTSAGSIVGAAIGAGMSLEEIFEMAKGITWPRVTGFSYSPKGMFSNLPMGRFIEQQFPVTRFEDLKIPFAAIACDLETGDEVVFKETGDLPTAVRASCAIPGVFTPVVGEGGRQLIDGGVVSPMPANAVRDLGADVVIAVDLLNSGSSFSSSPSTLLGVFIQSAMMIVRTAAKQQHYHADVVIIPQIAHLRMDQISKRDEFIRLGEEAALARIDEIKALIND
jgi:NTE family protein